LERDLEKKELPKYIEENDKLKSEVAFLKNENEIVKWYISIMEDGIDTK